MPGRGDPNIAIQHHHCVATGAAVGCSQHVPRHCLLAPVLGWMSVSEAIYFIGVDAKWCALDPAVKTCERSGKGNRDNNKVTSVVAGGADEVGGGWWGSTGRYFISNMCQK